MTDLSEEYLSLINDLFEWLVDPCLKFLKYSCVTFLKASDIHLCSSLVKLFDCLLKDMIKAQPPDMDEVVRISDVRK